MAERWERTMPCQDVHGRERDLRVFLGEDHSVGLQTPPGDVALITPSAVQHLNELVAAASLEAVRRGAEWG